MSKVLHLIRHAKSSWKDDTLADIDRPLNARGKKACELMAAPILASGCQFNHVFSSPAERARQTIKRIYREINQQLTPWQVDHALYTFSAEELKHWCRKLDDALDSVTIIGHNPALTDLCCWLASDCEFDNLPTCGYVQLKLTVDHWSELQSSCGKITRWLTPKKIQQDSGS